MRTPAALALALVTFAAPAAWAAPTAGRAPDPPGTPVTVLLELGTEAAAPAWQRVAALARAYLAFAERNPAVYDALFQLDGGLAYAQEDTPAPLKDAFAALMETLGEVAGDGVQPGLFTEVFWASLHGIATLTRAGRLLPEDAERRVDLLVDRLAVV
ncbi:TetR-like C-terminal domain-containing protein [Kitasatospora arboriphila]|uniref:HTH-type transcriptional regulator MT1864/Rv1816-like C-terminal domain-containing protein n=1 Tax=Kitasatospora arboriphila TaxID=258052 RepID=A0ABN1TG13_9ACTN